jgi:hypothetical protein
VKRALLLLFACAAAPAEAASGGAWLRDHALAEWSVGTGGWRTSIDADGRVPGFDAVGGGTELLAGLEVTSGLGLFASGRMIAGVRGGDLYLEALGGLGVQLRVNERVRVRAGAAAGRASLADEQGTLVGGFLAGSMDLVPLGAGGRLATALSVRLDIDGLTGGRALLPESSLALALGLGFRY